jgi:hypothetical protein
MVTVSFAYTLNMAEEHIQMIMGKAMGKGQFGRLCRRERMTNKEYQAMVEYDHVMIVMYQPWNIIRAVNFVQILKYLGSE